MTRGSTPVVKSIVKKLQTLPNVVNVASEADIEAGIAQLGINPTVVFPSSNLVFLRRQDGDVDTMYLLRILVARASRKPLPCRVEALIQYLSLSIHGQTSCRQFRYIRSLRTGAYRFH